MCSQHLAAFMAKACRQLVMQIFGSFWQLRPRFVTGCSSGIPLSEGWYGIACKQLKITKKQK
jgi:hypothetical protein